jgi:hypothetical protein
LNEVNPITREIMGLARLKPSYEHGEWNYTIAPNKMRIRNGPSYLFTGRSLGKPAEGSENSHRTSAPSNPLA